jgi:YesN/AraC family two-component response regulator
MFKVLIVDDEIVIRRGLKHIVDWAGFNCIVAGEAGDGIEGMAKIKELKPDIIFADIMMPGIDGLDMIKETRDIVPDAKIIILTGYRDFEYIQRALKLGAFDYSLKPSKIDNINGIVKNAVLKLEQEIKEKEAVIKLKREVEQSIPLIRQKLIFDLIFNIDIKEERFHGEIECGIGTKDYIVVIIHIEYENSQGKEGIFHQGIINTFNDVLSDSYMLFHVSISKNRIVFIVQLLEDKEFVIDTVNNKLELFKQIITQYYSFQVLIGVSGVGNNVANLNKKFNEALISMEDNLKKDEIHTEINDNIKDNKIHVNNTIPNIGNNETQNISLIIRKALEYMRANYNNSITLNDVAENTFVSSYYLSRLFSKELKKCFVDCLNEIRIEKAKEYLKKDNYKAYEVAELVGVNDSHYFSKLFKKYTGYTPSEYREN